MNILVKVCVAGILAFGLSACVVNVGDDSDYDGDYEKTRKAEKYNQSVISQLQLGAEQSALRSQLGVPDFSESFNKQGVAYDVLFYRTHRTHGDGMTTKDECTPMIFRQGKLVGWGDKAYQNL